MFSSRPYCSACVPTGFLLSGLLLCLLSAPLAAQQVTLERLWTGLKTESRITDFAASGDVGYVASPRGLEVYDLTTPRLQLLSMHELIPQGEVRLRVADDTLLLAWDADTGVSLFSIADPFAPRFLKHITLHEVRDVDARENYIFVIWHGSDHRSVGQFDWTEEELRGKGILQSMNGFRKVLVSGEYVYALGYGYDNDELHIARLREGGQRPPVARTNPLHIARLREGDYAKGAGIHVDDGTGDGAYIEGDYGLTVQNMKSYPLATETIWHEVGHLLQCAEGNNDPRDHQYWDGMWSVVIHRAEPCGLPDGVGLASAGGRGVSIRIFDVAGRQVAWPVNRYGEAGEGRGEADLSGLAPGRYHALLQYGGVARMTAMHLLP